MKSFLFVDLDQRTLPGSKGRALENIAQQCVASAVIESVGNDQLDPAIQRHIKGVGIFELMRVALKDKFFGIHPQITQQSVSNMRVAQLILNDRDGGAKSIERW